MSLLRFSLPLLVCFFLGFSIVLPASAQVAIEPECFVDSLSAASTNLNVLLHPFGQDTTMYSHEFNLPSTFPVFNKVFDLAVTDGVSDQWTKSQWIEFISAIMDNDSTQTDDVFGRTWGYFTRADGDLNENYSGVRFKQQGITFTKIRIQMYTVAELDSPCTYDPHACSGYSYFTQDGTITLNADLPLADVLGFGFAHELQHLCWDANGHPGAYESANESMSTLAEYFQDVWRDLIYDFPYDSSVLRGEPCDAESKYQVERTWLTYLYETFKGDEGDPTDDLIYRWIRSDYTFAARMRLDGLAQVLWDDDYDWVGGTDALDRLQKVFGNYLVAKFANAPDLGANGEFGIGTLNTVLDFGFFTDNCGWYEEGAEAVTPVDCPSSPGPGKHRGCWNVRVLIPEHELVDDNENNFVAVSGIYEDGDAPLPAGDGDNSKDYVDVNMLGTDYIRFRAGDYFDDAGEHELRLRLKGTFNKAVNPLFKEQFRVKPIGFVIAYASDSDTLQVHADKILFVKPVTFAPSTVTNDTTLMREVVVTDFGRSVKSVILALGVVPPFINSSQPWIGSSSGFTYQYDFGVFTPGASTRTWKGDVYALGDVSVPAGGRLNITPGTHVKVFDSDLGETGDVDRVEFNVRGELVADGSAANPIVFEPWAPSGRVSRFLCN